MMATGTLMLQRRYESERRRTKEHSAKLLRHADEVIARFDESWDALERAAQLYRERLEGIRDVERDR